MKIIFLSLMIVLAGFTSCSQNKSDIEGIWKITTKMANKPPTVNYIMFNKDNTFKMGIDSLGNKIEGVNLEGTWNVTNEGEIKIIPPANSGDPAYYVKIGDNQYKYTYFDKNGVKTKFTLTDPEWYLDKVK